MGGMGGSLGETWGKVLKSVMPNYESLSFLKSSRGMILKEVVLSITKYFRTSFSIMHNIVPLFFNKSYVNDQFKELALNSPNLV